MSKSTVDTTQREAATSNMAAATADVHPATGCRCESTWPLFSSGALSLSSLLCLRLSSNMEDEVDIDIEGDDCDNNTR